MARRSNALPLILVWAETGSKFASSARERRSGVNMTNGIDLLSLEVMYAVRYDFTQVAFLLRVFCLEDERVKRGMKYAR